MPVIGVRWQGSPGRPWMLFAPLSAHPRQVPQWPPPSVMIRCMGVKSSPVDGGDGG